MLDHHRAFADAGAAGRAGPQGVGLDDRPRSDQRAVGSRRRQIPNQRLRVQRLSGRESGTSSLATPALHTGVEAQQLVPAKIPSGLHAQPGRVQRQRPQRRIDVGLVETGRSRMKGQVQRARQRVPHRSPPHAGENLGARPDAQRSQSEVGQRGPPNRRPDTQVRAGCAQQERDESAQGPWQGVECAPRESRRTRRPAAPRHQRDPGRHHRQGRQQPHREPRSAQRGQALQQGQRRGEHQPAGGQHMHPRAGAPAGARLAWPRRIAQHHRVHIELTESGASIALNPMAAGEAQA